MFSILDANRGRVFTYDNTGMLLYIFGTYGDMGGALKNPRAIDKSGDLFLVLDGSKNTVTAYSPTAYARSFDRQPPTTIKTSMSWRRRNGGLSCL